MYMVVVLPAPLLPITAVIDRSFDRKTHVGENPNLAVTARKATDLQQRADCGPPPRSVGDPPVLRDLFRPAVGDLLSVMQDNECARTVASRP